jgi:predicted DNA-binding transcriptional regulator AlpA
VIAPAETIPAERSVNFTEHMPNAELLDIAGVAAFLGVGKSTARAMNDSGRLPLPVVHESKVIRFSRTELMAWTLAQCPSRVSWQQVREQRIKQFLAARGAA